jgi:Beta-propeller repeat
MSSAAVDRESQPSDHTHLTNRLEQLPLLFEENLGQVSPEIRYQAQGRHVSVSLSSQKMTWMIPQGFGHKVEMHLEGARQQLEIVAEEKLPTLHSYIKGSDPAGWHSGIRTYRKVRYRETYPGIDLLVYGREGEIEYDFVAQPGADPAVIRLRFEGIDKMELGSHGELILTTPYGEMRQKKPFAYQWIQGRQREVASTFRLLDHNTVAFETGRYDHSRSLTIDPVLVYSTYLGGSKEESVESVDVDSQGNVYVAGSTGSTDYPLAGAFQNNFAGGGSPLGDIVVSKFDSSGSFLVFSTFIGGSGTDVGRSVAVDPQGGVYVAGTTFSNNFPTTAGAFQTTCSGQCPFVVKLKADGSGLAYATFVGSSSDARAMVVDTNGQAVITGRTANSSFPVQNAFQPSRKGAFDSFVSKLNGTGNALVFSTYLGGTGDDNLAGEPNIAVDAAGNIYVTGTTESTDFPTMSAVQSTNRGMDDVFLTKFNPQGGMIYSTYLGGAADDHGLSVAADTNGNAYVTGETKSTNFPTMTPFQPAFGGGTGVGDAFLSKIGPNGNSLVLSTYLGGALGDRGNAVAVDELNRPVVVGFASNGFPLKNAFRNFEGQDAFVTKFAADGGSLIYSVNLGGLGGDSASSVATLGTRVFVAGNTNRANFPVMEALQARSAGGTNEGFLSQLSEQGSLHFAQFANGVGTVSELLLTNSSMLAASQATVTFAGDDGNPLAINVSVTANDGSQTPLGPVSTVNAVVPPLGVVKIITNGAGVLTSGSASVTFDNPLGGVVRFNLDPLGTTGVGESRALQGFITPVRRTAINTGVAVLNLESVSTGLRLTLRNRLGQQVPGGLVTLAMPPHGHLARFIDQLFPNANTANFEGTLTAEATTFDALIGATALELGSLPGQFTTLPVTPLP